MLLATLPLKLAALDRLPEMLGVAYPLASLTHWRLLLDYTAREFESRRCFGAPRQESRGSRVPCRA